MQTLIQKHRSAIEAFLEQRTHGVLVLRAAGEQIAYGMQILRAIATGGSPHLFLAFAHDFRSATDWASIVTERVQASEQAARAELGDKAKNLPGIPGLCLDTRQEPRLRIGQALVYARNLLQPASGRKLVCAFLPVAIHDPDGYGWLTRDLMKPRGLPAWYHGMRFILREDTNAPMFAGGLPDLAQTHDIDFSPPVLQAALEHEAMDPGSSREQQAQALFQLASLDYAHGRHADAVNRFMAVFAYYQETGNTAMQSMALIGVGDVHQLQGNLAEARGWYERAIPSASESGSFHALYRLARNLGQIAFQTHHFQDAESYFDSAQKLAPHLYDADGKVNSLELRALSQIQLAAHERARASLSEALEAARQFHKHEDEERISARIRELTEVR